MSSDEQQFCLRWNNFGTNIVSAFHSLRDDEDFVDVTLACDGLFLKAHKMVLSACSPYFRALFKVNPCQHPIVILKDVSHADLQAILTYMYQGEVNVREDKLAAFLKTAEMLKIRGLTDDEKKTDNDLENSHEYSSKVSQTTSNHVSPSPTPSINVRSLPDLTRAESPPVTDEQQQPSFYHPSGSRAGTPQFITTPKEEPLDLSDEQDNTGSVDDMETNVDQGALPQYAGSPAHTVVPGLTSVELGTNHRPEPLLGPPLPGPSNLHTEGHHVVPEPLKGPVFYRNLHLQMRSRERKPLQCKVCGKILSRLDKLKDHMKYVHSPPGIQVSCPLCSKSFKHQLSLKSHINIYHKPTAVGGTYGEEPPGTNSTV